ncbi:MAG TPA: hypothetical protein VHM91_12470 [Verrucomicrobiales bacterium]|jgi:hypothetical protein|nr:hypothetical protein [Verrucomicrobiales bacterium]
MKSLPVFFPGFLPGSFAKRLAPGDTRAAAPAEKRPGRRPHRFPPLDGFNALLVAALLVLAAVLVAVLATGAAVFANGWHRTAHGWNF